MDRTQASTLDNTILEITINPSNRFHQFLIKIGISPSVVKFKLRPIVLGARERYSRYALTLTFEENMFDNAVSVDNSMSVEKMRGLILCLATAIHNRDSKPPRSLVKFITRNFSTDDLIKSVYLIQNSLDTVGFLQSLITISGQRLTDPQDIDELTKKNN